MSTNIWIAVGIVFVLVWIVIIWEAWNSPIMPDDYNEQGINPDHERLKERINGSNDEKQYKKGLYNGKTDTWYPDNKI
tara:strand:+ start:332 stop:565 length:234 start_codon:yes stop_codon:yes gene_type:complete